MVVISRSGTAGVARYVRAKGGSEIGGWEIPRTFNDDVERVHFWIPFPNTYSRNGGDDN